MFTQIKYHNMAFGYIGTSTQIVVHLILIIWLDGGHESLVSVVLKVVHFILIVLLARCFEIMVFHNLRAQ